MFEVNENIRIPDDEFHWSFARSGGPGGQNVNKVSSKALLRWDVNGTSSLPDVVKDRLRSFQRRRFTTEGELLLTSQRWRDQERNRQDCLDKLREMLLQAADLPKPRRTSRITRGAKERRLAAKRRRAGLKQQRRCPDEE